MMIMRVDCLSLYLWQLYDWVLKRNKVLPGQSVLLKCLAEGSFELELSKSLSQVWKCKILKNAFGKTQWCVCGGSFDLNFVLKVEAPHIFWFSHQSDGKIWYFFATGRPVLLAQKSCQSEIVHHWQENYTPVSLPARPMLIHWSKDWTGRLHSISGEGCPASVEKASLSLKSVFSLFICNFYI